MPGRICGQRRDHYTTNRAAAVYFLLTRGVHMLTLPSETEVLDKVVRWANARADIRAVIISSSRVRPGAPVDMLSDYDVILAVTDVERFAHDDAWIHEYGRLMVLWGDQSQLYGLPTYFRGAIYADYVKVDWSIWPVALLERVAAEPSLPDTLDVGYKVLLDKDSRTAGWQPPRYRAHIPARPTAAEYLAVVEEFWWSATYVAKSLWRDELVFARFCLDPSRTRHDHSGVTQVESPGVCKTGPGR